MSRIVKLFHMALFAVICAVGLLGFSLPAHAADEGAIKLTYPIAGVEFSVYQVGVYNDENNWELVDALVETRVDLTSKDAAATLAGYILENDVKALQTDKTDADGVLTFTNLGHAAYLVVGEAMTVDRTTYTPSPVLLSLPQEKNGNLEWTAEIHDKYTTLTYRDLMVKKIWKKDNEKVRPESIEVKLYKDKEEYRTAILNADNDWSFTWEDLEEGPKYTVVESRVPENYLVSTSQLENKIVLTNIYNPPETPPETPPGTPPPKTPPRLPKTGQLWWPVGILVCGGLLCMMLGWMIRRKKNM